MSEKSVPLPRKISLVKDVSNFANFFCGLAGKKGCIRVLVYHNITDKPIPGEWMQMTTPRDLFNRQMRYLNDNGYNAVLAEDVPKLLAGDRDIPERTVSITFDDGYKDNFNNAFPILYKYGLKATVFATAGFIGKGKIEEKEYLNWQEAREMRKSGIFRFGCHSLMHRKLSRLATNELVKEIKEAKDILENNLSEEIGIFAYPFGWHDAFNAQVTDRVRGEGFSCAFTAIHGANTKKRDPFCLRRIRVSWLQEIPEFEKVLRGAYDWYSLYQKAFSLWARC